DLLLCEGAQVPSLPGLPATLIPFWKIQNLDRGFAFFELPEDSRFAVSTRNGSFQDLLDRIGINEHYAIAGAHHNVPRTNGNSTEIDEFVQGAKLFFRARANGQSTTEDGEAPLRDGFDVPHRTVDHQACNAPRLRRNRQHFSPSSGVLISFGIGHQHAAWGRKGYGLMQHEIVALRAAYGDSRTAKMSTIPHRPTRRIHHSSLSGGLISRCD